MSAISRQNGTCAVCELKFSASSSQLPLTGSRIKCCQTWSKGNSHFWRCANTKERLQASKWLKDAFMGPSLSIKMFGKASPLHGGSHKHYHTSKNLLSALALIKPIVHSNSQQCSHLQDHKLQEPFNFFTRGGWKSRKVGFPGAAYLSPGIQHGNREKPAQDPGSKLTLIACWNHPSTPRSTVHAEKHVWGEDIIFATFVLKECHHSH